VKKEYVCIKARLGKTTFIYINTDFCSSHQQSHHSSTSFSTKKESEFSRKKKLPTTAMDERISPPAPASTTILPGAPGAAVQTVVQQKPFEIRLPGTFVVLQGIPGDGLSNTVQSTPVYVHDPDADDDNEDDNDEDDNDNSSGHGRDDSEDIEDDMEGDEEAMDATAVQSSTATQTRAFASAGGSTGGLLLPKPGGGLLMSHLAKTTKQTATLGMTSYPTNAFSTHAAAVPSQPPPPTTTEAATSFTNLSNSEDSFVVIPSEQQIPSRTVPTSNSSNVVINPSFAHATPTPALVLSDHRDDKKVEAIQQWRNTEREENRMARREWLLMEHQRQLQLEQEQQQQQQRNHRHRHQSFPLTVTTTARPTETDDWWIDAETGQLAVFDHLPYASPRGNTVITGSQLGTLAPGSTFTAHQLITLDSETLQVLHVDEKDTTCNSNAKNTGDDDEMNTKKSKTCLPPPLAPSVGCIQLLQLQWTTGTPSNNNNSSSGTAIVSGSPPALHTVSMSSYYGKKQGESKSGTRLSDFKSQKRRHNATTTCNAYCVYSIHGYQYLIPGTPELYMDPNSWWWRVTCKVGAYLRQGLELSSDHICTIPYGSFVQVTRKTVNRMGLSRLRVVAPYNNNHHHHHHHHPNATTGGTSDSHPSQPMMVQGWCSEFLNPLSGQRGHVVQPVPFCRPARYRVTLPEGAVIREDIELSSPQVGLAPQGRELTIVARQFSEHPQDQCVERLKLAGGKDSGWISVRLNHVPPDNTCVVELIGVDNSFDVMQPGKFHWKFLKKQHRLLMRQHRDENHEQGSTSSGSNDLSSMEGAEGTGGIDTNIMYSAKARFLKQQAEKCLICLAEERNATMVHGETGHIACCLVCARILKARGDRCPVCRLPIDSVIQHFWA